ncbi:MAG: hypothetical protein P8Y03_21590 [Anaerolineales bacterium]
MSGCVGSGVGDAVIVAEGSGVGVEMGGTGVMLGVTNIAAGRVSVGGKSYTGDALSCRRVA